jgi:prepilin-type N-terminal cleavage/methylation domain-containing protein
MNLRGFSLIEVLVAVGLVCIAVLGGVQLVVAAMQAMSAARAQNLAVSLASARLEELRGLRFEFDDTGVPVTDLGTDLSTAVPTASGSGLAAGGSIQTSVTRYVDHLDRLGQWVGNSASPPPQAAYTRRWSLTPSAHAFDALVAEVAVFPTAASLTGGSASGVPGSARFVTLLARTQR